MKLTSQLHYQNTVRRQDGDNRFSLVFIGLGLFLLFGLLGLISYRLPFYVPELMMTLGLLLPVGLLLWSFPELGIVGLIFLTASIVQPDLVDMRLSIGGGLDLRDLALLFMLAISVIRSFALGQVTIPWFPVGGPLTLFLVLAAFSVFVALFFKNVATNWAMNDFRILLYYSLFFITAWNLRSHAQISTLLMGLLIVADITAAVVIIQQFRGADNLLLESMAYGQWQVWAQEDGTVRVVPPGHVLIHFMMIVAFGLLLFNLSNWKRFLFFGFQFLFLSTGQLLTFTRAGWIASFISILIVSLVVAVRYKEMIPRLLMIGIASVLLLISAIGISAELGFVRLGSSTSLQDRFATIFTPRETLESYSLQWRLFEFEKASEAIQDNPILGVSLGNSYRSLTVYQGEAVGLWTDGDTSAANVSRYTRFIHSSYLSIATKLGLTGIFAYLWFCLGFILYGRYVYRTVDNPHIKAIILTSVAGFIGLLQWSIFHAWLIETESTSVIGVIVGMVAAIASIEMNQPQAGTLAQPSMIRTPNFHSHRP